MEKLKILQISNYMYPHIGGIEQVARDVAVSLRERSDIEQKIICFNEDAKDGDLICRRKETVRDTVEGIEVIRCGCVAKIASQSLSPSYPTVLYKLLKSFEPDIVIFHYPNPFTASFLLPMLNKKTRLILFWHLDIVKQKHLGKLFHRQNIALCRRADRIIATSPDYIKGSPYLSRFSEKCTAFPLCIDEKRLGVTDRIRAGAAKIRRKFSGKTVVFAIGRHVEYKGMKYLVDAARQIDDSFEVLIAGKGPLTRELVRSAQGCGHIHFIGRIDDETLTACLLACDIFAFPSITRNEAFGIALAEAMYFGKPSVTFTINGSGVNFVSPAGITGIECPNGDSAAFADALRKLGNDKELRMKFGRAARQRALDNFLPDRFAANILNLISEVGR